MKFEQPLKPSSGEVGEERDVGKYTEYKFVFLPK